MATLIAGSTCLAAGVVLFFVFGIVGILESTVYQAPIRTTVECQVGDYYLFQNTGNQQTGPGFSITHDSGSTLTPSDVRVVAPDGSQVPTWAGDGSETITKGSQIYTSTVGFHVSAPGNYFVSVGLVSPGAIIIAPSLGSQFADAAPWLILAGVGMLIALAGLVSLLVGSARRKRAGAAPLVQ